MPVPKNKKELIQQSEDNFFMLNTLIDSFSKKEKAADFPIGTMNRNLRDVIAHLYHWQMMFMDWYKVGMKGDKPDMPSKGYSWKNTKDLNKKIWEDYQNHSLDELRKSLKDSHLKLQEVMGKHVEVELFEKKRYKWTGSSSLSTYIRASTSSHYKWAYTLIKKMKINSK